MDKKIFRSAYLRLHQKGELAERADKAVLRLSRCTLCPRRCKVNRLQEEKGYCRTGRLAVVASYCPHFGEEAPLVGSGGSGTIFFTHCNLGCVFCQNYEISHGGEGTPMSSSQLAAIMLQLQMQGCHNINFVTPSHVIPQILEALVIAAEKGLTVPLVYNSSAYDETASLKILDGVIDIYMPDFKFWSSESAQIYCDAPDYPKKARQAILAMHQQVGDLVCSTNGIAKRGLLVRHLVMPDSLDETRSIMEFLTSKISADTYVNVMEQYRPCGEARKFRKINRMLSHQEYREALAIAREAGLKRLDERNWQRLLKNLGIR